MPVYLCIRWDENHRHPLNYQLEIDEKTAKIITANNQDGAYIEIKHGCPKESIRCLLVFGRYPELRAWGFSKRENLELSMPLIKKQNPNMAFWTGFPLQAHHVPWDYDE